MSDDTVLRMDRLVGYVDVSHHRLPVYFEAIDDAVYLVPQYVRPAAQVEGRGHKLEKGLVNTWEFHVGTFTYSHSRFVAGSVATALDTQLIALINFLPQIFPRTENVDLGYDNRFVPRLLLNEDGIPVYRYQTVVDGDVLVMKDYCADDIQSPKQLEDIKRVMRSQLAVIRKQGVASFDAAAFDSIAAPTEQDLQDAKIRRQYRPPDGRRRSAGKRPSTDKRRINKKSNQGSICLNRDENGQIRDVVASIMFDYQKYRRSFSIRKYGNEAAHEMAQQFLDEKRQEHGCA